MHVIVVPTFEPPQCVAQVEHARASTVIASAWDPVALFGKDTETTYPEAVRHAFIEAVRAHDDGWTWWDAAPTRDEHGIAIDFKNISTANHVFIWRRSIRMAAHAHPYQGLMVALHAHRLYGDVPDPSHDPVEQAIESRLMKWLDARLEAWRRELKVLGQPWRDAEPHVVQHASMLSFFDALTLMMLRGVPREERLMFADQYTLDWSEEGVLRMSPWHLTVSSLDIQMTTTTGTVINWTMQPKDA